MTILDLYTDERLDQDSSLQYTIPADDPKASLIVADTMNQFEDVMYYVAEIDQERQGTSATISVKANQLWMRLAERSYVGSFVLSASTVADGLDAILAAHGGGWTRNVNTVTGGTTYSYEAQDQSYLALLLGWAKVTDTVLVWDTLNKKVDMVTSTARGVDRGISFRYGRNLTQIKRKVVPPKVTRLYPFGRDDLTIAGVNGGVQYIEDYSFYTDQGISLVTAQALYRKDEIWSQSDIVDDTALLAAAQARLATLSGGVIEYSMGVSDLSELTGTEESSIRVGDVVRVRDTTLGFNVRATVVRLQKYPLEPWKNRVELAYLYDPSDGSGGGGSRPQSALTWEMYQDRSNRISARNNGIYLACRIPLAFSDRAEAVYGCDIQFVGVGTGSLQVSAVDAASGYNLEHGVISIPYTNGETVHRAFTWSHDTEDTTDTLNGEKDYRIRIKAVPTVDGGASASGIEVDQFGARFWILARGAVKREPTTTNSQRFDYTGAVQTFTVPDSVEEITIEAFGAAGGGVSGYRGKGGRVQAKYRVLPGAVYDVYVGGVGGSTNGGHGSTFSDPGWPNGGTGGQGSPIGSTDGYGGGGSSHVIATGGTFADALIVAGAGGGHNRTGSSRSTDDGLVQAGDAGFFNGTAGKGRDGVAGEGGGGASQWAGGAAGTDTAGGSAGSFGQGASGPTGGGAFTFQGGGGGGGWYGGGCTGLTAILGGGQYSGDAGGGSGWVATDSGFDIDYTDATNDADGYVIISWTAPDT